MTSEVSSVGVLGAGRVGAAVARQAVAAGYRVSVAGSGAARDIALLVDITVPGALAVTAGVAARSDLVVVAIPLPKFRTLPARELRGRVVIDAMNYWPPVDGSIAEFADDRVASSLIVQAFLGDAKVVRTLNHIGYHELEADGRPAGAPDRRALAVASDHDDASQLAAAFLDRLGFDTVILHSLADSRAFAPGTSIFSARHTEPELLHELESALEGSSSSHPNRHVAAR